MGTEVGKAHCCINHRLIDATRMVNRIGTQSWIMMIHETEGKRKEGKTSKLETVHFGDLPETDEAAGIFPTTSSCTVECWRRFQWWFVNIHICHHSIMDYLMSSLSNSARLHWISSTLKLGESFVVLPHPARQSMNFTCKLVAVVFLISVRLPTSFGRRVDSA